MTVKERERERKRERERERGGGVLIMMCLDSVRSRAPRLASCGRYCGGDSQPGEAANILVHRILQTENGTAQKLLLFFFLYFFF